MGRFDKFAENAGEEIKPVAISKKQIVKKSDKTKSIKIWQVGSFKDIRSRLITTFT